jgi:heme-degrading monooxygenase HmoA
MFVALWEYEVKPGGEERFENAYGPDGDWVGLFRRDTHYYETRLVRDTLHPGVYLTMDFWESRGAYEAFMAGHGAEYKAMDAICEDMTMRERKVGWFEMVEGSSE